MEPFDSKKVTSISAVLPSPEEQLSELFGSYKAEWLRGRIFEFFTAPDYLPELMTPRPCILVGGRGTGKTTVLKGLSYEGQYALTGRDASKVCEWPFYGLYLRVNTNRVTAFDGPELQENLWKKVFAHYFNLVLCDLVLRFLEWFEVYTSTNVNLPTRKCYDVAASLHLPQSGSIRELLENLSSSRLQFESHVNNIADCHNPPLSMQGAPVDALCEGLGELPEFRGKTFFFLIDEYENFMNYQQQVVNTLIKHSGEWYTFKIGVRELGWRVRSTLNPEEQLISPADYVRINIVDKLYDEAFKRFAGSVCSKRLAQIELLGQEPLRDMERALPGLSEEEEAEKLGVNQEIRVANQELTALLSQDKPSMVQELSPFQLYFLKSWAEAQHQPVEEVAADFLRDRNKWDVRFGNYKHSLLYAIKRGKIGIRKYYAGWDTFTQLAAGNIRYLIALVDESLLLHIRKGNQLSQQVSPETQTLAAQSVGKKNLGELEGLSVHGAKLTKLILGLGRIFQVMAAEPLGHTPETNQFRLEGDGENEDVHQSVDGLLNAAVMHLALLRFTGSKAVDEADTRDYDYMVHPIFSAFFVFSHRRKRKMSLSPTELLGLVREPREFIRLVLASQNRSDEEELPEQMRLFEGYYGAGS